MIREYATDDQGRIIRENPGGKAHKKKSNPEHEKEGEGEKKELQGVFVVSDGKVQFVLVEVDIMGDTEIEITEGLKEDTLIVTGSYKTLRKLKDEDLIKDNKGREES
ncbi:hypothetical protein MYX78_05865 [Acidobacteria bacterium AH-259-G07]|nr:hypothetical protein [Acidobacteria bacterium AH-259-G07]